VLEALFHGKIEYGVFARKSRIGLVEESEKAIQKWGNFFQTVETMNLPIHHVLLQRTKIEEPQKVTIVSHPQALKEHTSTLKNRFAHLTLHPEANTIVAIEKLQRGDFPKNTLIIAPKECAELYELNVFEASLLDDPGYITTFWLVKK